MKFILQIFKIHKTTFTLVVVTVVIGVGMYLYMQSGSEATPATYAIVQKVELGTVSSGIITTGEIIAAQKLDLDVYKQAQRIEKVNVVNGGHVESGDTILSFDKSGAYVDVQSSQVSIAEKELALKNEQSNYTDPNTTLRTREQEISDLKTSITQAEQDKIRAFRDFLNANVRAESGNSKTLDKTAPTMSGLYSGTTAGVYRISVYGSGTKSGYSYRVSGLESSTESVITSKATNVGTLGLEIMFPTDIQSGDEWVIAVPNTYAPEYVENKEDYEKAIIDLNEAIAGYKLSIANKEEEIKDLRQTDNVSNRDLDIAKAEAELSEARVQLAQNYDVMKEQDMVAPFSGTIEGFENVVVGATPTRDTNDPITLGTLISDDFLVDFALGAVDITKVKVGQKVLVTVTSFPNAAPLEARVTEISSLPDESGVAQYGVQALITLPENSSLELREGLIADVEVVQEEKEDVIRIPLSAITYENGKATVQVLSELSVAESEQVERLGVLRSETGIFSSYPVVVTLGVQGSFYAEIVSGLETGMLIIASKTEQEESTVTQTQFGPGSGQNQNRTSEGSTQQAPPNSNAGE
ncbi:MAG: HlyD family efflux transporter periplasmic adaptor subunit [Minisyncoccia bacterium]